jgi:flagellin-like protein
LDVKGRKNSGISPVVATVILVAVAIVIAIAVAFWASGLVGVFTRFEKIEIVSAYYDATGEGKIIVIAKNSGSSAAVIDAVFVNGAPCTSYTPTTVALTIGATDTIEVTSCFVRGGVTNEIALHTTSGKTYPVAVLVP